MLEQWTKSSATSDLTQLTQQITELKQLIQTGITAVKSIQRGVTTEATTITIDAVNMTKAVVMSVSKSSEGQVRASGYINTNGNIKSTPTNSNSPSFFQGNGYIGGGYAAQNHSYNTSPLSAYYNVSNPNQYVVENAPYPATVYQSGSMTPNGTTNLTTRQYSAHLTSETTLECDGAVEWQIIEFN